MKAGKLSESILKRSVFKQLHKRDEKVLARPAVGEDAGAVQLDNGQIMVVATESLTIASKQSGALAVQKATNNLYAKGAKPSGITMSLLVSTATTEQELRRIVKEVDVFCEELGIELVNGHTEVTRAVTKPMLTITAFGTMQTEAMLSAKCMKTGMDLVLTKAIGLEGTALLAIEKEEELSNRFSVPFLAKAKEFMLSTSIRSEAEVAAKSGACAMHDLSEGGVFGALWEMAEAAGVGLKIDLKAIPIRQETVEICEFFDVNPYKLLSGGSLLIATCDGNGLILKLKEAGIEAAIIGKTTDGNDRILLAGEEGRFLETTQTDEIRKILDK